eukprot:2634099-Rhodomonas_salina.1
MSVSVSGVSCASLSLSAASDPTALASASPSSSVRNARRTARASHHPGREVSSGLRTASAHGLTLQSQPQATASIVRHGLKFGFAATADPTARPPS